MKKVWQQKKKEPTSLLTVHPHRWIDRIFFFVSFSSSAPAPSRLFYHFCPDSVYFLRSQCSVLRLPISMVHWDSVCIPQQPFSQHISLAWLSDLAEGVGVLPLSLVIYSCTFSIIHCWLALLKHAEVTQGYSSQTKHRHTLFWPSLSHRGKTDKRRTPTHGENIIITI